MYKFLAAESARHASRQRAAAERSAPHLAPTVLECIVHVYELRTVESSKQVAFLHHHSNVISLNDDGLGQRFHSIPSPTIISSFLYNGINLAKTALETGKGESGLFRRSRYRCFRLTRLSNYSLDI